MGIDGAVVRISRQTHRRHQYQSFTAGVSHHFSLSDPLPADRLFLSDPCQQRTVSVAGIKRHYRPGHRRRGAIHQSGHYRFTPGRSAIVSGAGIRDDFSLDIPGRKIELFSHFRNNPDIISVSMELVLDFAKDFVLPIDFDSEEHDPTLENGCGEKCKVKRAKAKGLIKVS